MHPGSRLLCLLALPDFATPRPEDTDDCSPAAGQGHNPPDSLALLSSPLRARSHVGSINAPKCVPAGLRNLCVMLCRATGSGRELGCGCPAMPPLLKSWRPTIRHAKRQLPDRWRQLMRVRVWEDGVAAAGSQALTQAGSFASSARRRLPGMDDAFYLPLGHDRWRATVHTAGPWDTRFQHGGPPSALLARAIERCSPREDMLVARMAVDILGGIPVDDLELRSRVLRPGRSVELVEAALSAGGRDVARAQAWRVLRTTQKIAPRQQPAQPLPTETAEGAPSSVDGWLDGYLSAVEWRFTAGAFGRPGSAAAWTRLRYPLVDGEPPSPLQRVLAVADSGNGISSELELADWHFINPELTVHLHREAIGEWVCLEAQTAISPGGVGLATSALSDLDGPIGVGAQSLLVAQR